jgi:hypothetical protein
MLASAATGGFLTTANQKVIGHVANVAGFVGAMASTLGVFASMKAGTMTATTFWGIFTANTLFSILAGPFTVGQWAAQQTAYTGTQVIAFVGHTARTAWGLGIGAWVGWVGSRP